MSVCKQQKNKSSRLNQKLYFYLASKRSLHDDLIDEYLIFLINVSKVVVVVVVAWQVQMLYNYDNDNESVRS